MKILPDEVIAEEIQQEPLRAEIQNLTQRVRLVLQKARNQKEKMELTSQLQAATNALNIASTFAR